MRICRNVFCEFHAWYTATGVRPSGAIVTEL
jgi:hypothetical protein